MAVKAQVIDGKQTSLDVQEKIRQEVEKDVANGEKKPHLAAVLVGDDGASQTYVNHKVKACERVGFLSTLIELPDSISEEELLTRIKELNEDQDIDGFIVQLPLPEHINELKIKMAVAPEKDVDGFHPQNVGRMVMNLPTYLPATPYGIITMLEHYNIPTKGKHCVVVGRSQIVGSPMSILLARDNYPGNATVTLTHRYSENLIEHTTKADILIVAVGIPDFIKPEMIKEGATVIDVGITRVEDATKKRGFRLNGDVAYESVAEKAGFITPVPGGVGPMTIASLLLNTLSAARKEIYSTL